MSTINIDTSSGLYDRTKYGINYPVPIRGRQQGGSQQDSDPSDRKPWHT